MDVMALGTNEQQLSLVQADKPITAGVVTPTITIRIAPQSASEMSDRRAVRTRRRRERPQKLMDVGNSGQEAGSAQGNVYKPDIESFVSNCIPGVSFAAGSTDDVVSQRRSKLIRKRSLPLLSFLSSTHLAAAEKKRKKEEQYRQNAIAEEEAKKALLLNPIQPAAAIAEGESFVAGDTKQSTNESRNAQLREGGAVNHVSNIQPTDVDNTPTEVSTKTPTVTTTMEKTSNILLPPMLQDFLKQLDNCNPG